MKNLILLTIILTFGSGCVPVANEEVSEENISLEDSLSSIPQIFKLRQAEKLNLLLKFPINLVTGYQYKLGNVDIDCSDPAGYSSMQTITTPITDSIVSLSSNTSIPNSKICVDLVDKNGKKIGDSLSKMFIVDLERPSATILGAPSTKTNTTQFNFTISSTDPKDVKSFRYKTGLASNINCSSPDDYSKDMDPSEVISITNTNQVQMVFCALAIDHVGNVQRIQNVTSKKWTIDTISPTVILSNVPTGVSSSTSLNIGISSTDPSDLYVYKYKVGRASDVNCSVEAGYSALIQSTTSITNNIASLPDGLLKICVIGTDEAGNTQSSATTTSWTKDTTAPIVTFSNTPLSKSSTTSLNIAVSSSSPSDLHRYKYKVGVASSVNCADLTNYSGFISPSVSITNNIASLSDVDIKICAFGIDELGNTQGTPTAFVWTKDTTSPIAGLTDTPSILNTLTGSFLNISVSDTDTFSYRYKIGNASLNCSDPLLYSSSLLVSAYPQIVDDVSGFSSNSAVANTKICVIAKDEAGNEQAVASATSHSWLTDLIVPTAVIVNNPSLDPNNSTLNISISANSTVGYESYRYLLSEGDIDCTDNSNYISMTLGSNITADFSSIVGGTQMFLCVLAKDVAGNEQLVDDATSVSWTYNVNGCTDSSAVNYNELANIDNGTCSFDKWASVPDHTASGPYSNCQAALTSLSLSEALVKLSLVSGNTNIVCRKGVSESTVDKLFYYALIATVRPSNNPLWANMQESTGFLDDQRLSETVINQIWNASLIKRMLVTLPNDFLWGSAEASSWKNGWYSSMFDSNCDFQYGSTFENWGKGWYQQNGGGQCIHGLYSGMGRYTYNAPIGSTLFYVASMSSTPGYTYGCTDKIANNFDPTANLNDGSCEYNYGCMDSIANNYDEAATMDNGTCGYNYGCMDSYAMNYDSNATMEDWTCEYKQGCTDSEANNYDSTAYQDDNSCTYDFPGCTDSNALNFDSTALYNDGSCVYNSWASYPDHTASGTYSNCQKALTNLGLTKALVKLNPGNGAVDVVCRKGMAGGSAGTDSNNFYALIANIGASTKSVWSNIQLSSGYLAGTRLSDATINLIWSTSNVKRMLITSGDEAKWGAANATAWFGGGFNSGYDSNCGFSYGATIEGYGNSWYQQNGYGQCLHGNYNNMGRYHSGVGNTMFYISSMGP